MKKIVFFLLSFLLIFIFFSCAVSSGPIRDINKHNKKELRGPRNTKPLNSIGDQNKRIISASPGGMTKSCPAI
ncbi:MAG: hypothetical protein WCY43_03910 [Patescibacteria group bacterium]|nr:hypothetical protein [Patescibacteria group bacterium]